MWPQDLLEGQQVEREVIPYLERFYPGSECWQNKLNPYICDLWWKWPDYEKPFKVEVKYDRLSEKTGNVALEHHSLLTSTAAFVVYLAAGHVCLLDGAEVRRLIDEYPVTVGGDQNHLLTLVPKDDFIRRSTLI